MSEKDARPLRLRAERKRRELGSLVKLGLSEASLGSLLLDACFEAPFSLPPALSSSIGESRAFSDQSAINTQPEGLNPVQWRLVLACSLQQLEKKAIAE
jgi:hypothetical protein